MRDGGDSCPPCLDRDLDTRYWEEALPLYAELQIDAAADAERLMQAGAFDRRSAGLPSLYEQLIAEPPVGQTPAEYERLQALVPDVERVAGELAASPVPETINNDDFTHGSIFLHGGSYRFLDWGDACVSHPFFTLTVTQRVIEKRHGSRLALRRSRIRDAYLEPFTVYRAAGRLEGSSSQLVGSARSRVRAPRGAAGIGPGGHSRGRSVCCSIRRPGGVGALGP